jgi:hypothetical protein
VIYAIAGREETAQSGSLPASRQLFHRSRPFDDCDL